MHLCWRRTDLGYILPLRGVVSIDGSIQVRLYPGGTIIIISCNRWFGTRSGSAADWFVMKEDVVCEGDGGSGDGDGIDALVVAVMVVMSKPTTLNRNQRLSTEKMRVVIVILQRLKHKDPIKMKQTRKPRTRTMMKNTRGGGLCSMLYEHKYEWLKMKSVEVRLLPG